MSLQYHLEIENDSGMRAQILKSMNKIFCVADEPQFILHLVAFYQGPKIGFSFSCMAWVSKFTDMKYV